MPALAIMVMSRSTMCSDLSQYASVPATSRNGRPDENPKKHIVHAAGCVNARHTEGLAGLGAGTAVLLMRTRPASAHDRKSADLAPRCKRARAWPARA